MVVRRFAAVAVVGDAAAAAGSAAVDVVAAAAKTVIVSARFVVANTYISERILRVSHEFSQHFTSN